MFKRTSGGTGHFHGILKRRKLSDDQDLAFVSSNTCEIKYRKVAILVTVLRVILMNLRNFNAIVFVFDIRSLSYSINPVKITFNLKYS
jgi:hypothetical protein